jgi:hypothetical protein
MESPLFWLLVYGALVLSRVQFKDLLKTIGDIAESLLSVSKQAGNTIQSTNNQVFKTLENVLELAADAFTRGIDALGVHVTHVASQLSNGKGNLASRILGSLVSLVAMLTFLYADTALGFQAAQTLFPDIAVPVIFRDIGIALVAASVGTIFALGMLFWDALGFTDFTNLSQMKGFAKGAFIGSVVITAVITLACVALVALNRASLVANLISPFSPELQGEIHRLASLAHSLVVIPLLVTTFLMLRGVYGLLVIYAAVAGVISLLFQLIRVLLKLLRKIVTGAGISEVVASGILLALTNLVLLLLGWSLGLLIAGTAALTNILQKVLDVVTTPPVVIWDFVTPLAKQLLAKSAAPRPSVDKLPDEYLLHLIKLYPNLLKPDLPAAADGQGPSLETKEGEPDLDAILEITGKLPRNNNHN